jgi:hypothetical protein
MVDGLVPQLVVERIELDVSFAHLSTADNITRSISIKSRPTLFLSLLRVHY